MPTAFDHFGREACSNYPNLPAEVIHNRELLQKAMRRHGFSTISTEWWHFNAPHARGNRSEDIRGAARPPGPCAGPRPVATAQQLGTAHPQSIDA